MLRGWVSMRKVVSIPKHFLGNEQRLTEYKIAKCRMCMGSKEVKKLLSYYIREDLLKLYDINVSLHMSIEWEDKELGDWIIKILREVFEKKLTIYEFNTLLYYYSRFWDGDAALNIFKEMKERNIQPNNDTYSHLMRVCAYSLRQTLTDYEDPNKYKKLAKVIMDGNLNQFDGRYHLLRAIIHYCSVSGDRVEFKKWSDLLLTRNDVNSYVKAGVCDRKEDSWAEERLKVISDERTWISRAGT